MNRISIIVPVLNEEATVQAALSRLCRDFPGCELIVVDGGSTDAPPSNSPRRTPPWCTAHVVARGR